MWKTPDRQGGGWQAACLPVNDNEESSDDNDGSIGDGYDPSTDDKGDAARG